MIGLVSRSEKARIQFRNDLYKTLKRYILYSETVHIERLNSLYLVMIWSILNIEMVYI